MTWRVEFGVNKEPVNAWSHFLGFLAAIVGLVFLVVASAHHGPTVTGMAIYGGSLVLLFFASASYHFFDFGPRGNVWLRRFDHAAIFLLIAGTYVPILIVLLRGGWRVSMLSVVGGLAVLGVAFKMFWIRCPDWLSTSIYLLLGWLVVVPAYKILPQMSASQLALLGAGGLAYTVGAVVELRCWPDPWPDKLGSHGLWHFFVLAGAASHYFLVFDLIDGPAAGH